MDTLLEEDRAEVQLIFSASYLHLYVGYWGTQVLAEQLGECILSPNYHCYYLMWFPQIVVL